MKTPRGLRGIWAGLALMTGTWLLMLVGCHPGAHASPAFSVSLESYPMRPGTRVTLRYKEFRKGSKDSTWMEETTLAGAHNDLLEYRVRTIKGSQVRKSRFYVVVRDNGLYYRAGDDAPALELTDAMRKASPRPDQMASPALHSITGGLLLLRFPLVPDLMWEYQHPLEGLASRRVVGMESVEVPAGKFDAVKIEEKRDSGAGTSWYVAGKGIVKSDLSGSTSRYIKELVKFEIVPLK